VGFSDHGAGRFNVWRGSAQRHVPFYKHALTTQVRALLQERTSALPYAEHATPIVLPVGVITT
jgi:hypothetical protein